MNNDKLIAKFMELDIDGENVTDGILETTISKLRYQTSWDWLMPVVEKIETLGFGFTVDPWGMVIIEYISGNEKEIISFINYNNYPKLFQYYDTVTQFIKWYNDQNK